MVVAITAGNVVARTCAVAAHHPLDGHCQH